MHLSSVRNVNADTNSVTFAFLAPTCQQQRCSPNGIRTLAHAPTPHAQLKNDDWGHSDNEDEDDVDDSKLSKTQYKKLHRLSVAELKQLVERPDVIEVHDVTAADPKLLVLLKVSRNSSTNCSIFSF